jgi:hypothetical protein
MTNKNQNPWISIEAIHKDLLDAKKYIYNPFKFQCSQPIMEKESIEYGAYSFELNGFFIRFRVAKTTPTKIGQFVTLWKRIGNGPIQPYDISDPVDFFVVSVRKDNHFGQFIFSKAVLCKQNILSMHGKGGKRAIRVYPPWDQTLNRQAQKTQKWQMECFLDLSPDKEIDHARAQMLYSEGV